MPDTLDPGQNFEKSAEEGERRLDQGMLELLSTGFIAGFTILFGMIALAVMEGLARPSPGELSKLLGEASRS